MKAKHKNMRIFNVRAVNFELREFYLPDKDICELVKESGPLLKTLDLTCWDEFSGEGLIGHNLEFPKHVYISLSQCLLLKNKGLIELLRNAGPHLTTLNLQGTGVSGESLGYQLKFPKLEIMDLSWGSLTDRGLTELLRMAGNQLLLLDLAVSGISGEGLISQDFKFPNLSYLSLFGCRDITDRGLWELLMMSGPHLRTIVLEQTNITGEGLNGLKFPELESVYLGECDRLTNSGLSELLTMSGFYLTNLDLSETSISGAVLADWVENKQQEHHFAVGKLNLKDCHNVTGSGSIA